MTQEPTSALLGDPHFGELRDWIIQHTGLSYYNQRDAEVAQALESVFPPRREGQTAGALLQRLRSSPVDLDALVEKLTIGETFFFRHLEMFQALRSTVFPDLLARRAASRSLRIWSAGCSIGAEPYSISILLRELLGVQFQNWSIHILGTDINRKFLRIAEEGEFDPWTLRGLPPHVLHRSFIKEGRKWRLNSRCRQDVFFRSHNLATDALPDPAHDLFNFDLIICRNVMIYFDLPFIQRLAQKFYDTLCPGGWLAVGHAEPHTDTFRMFRTVNTPGAVLYQRAATDAAGAADAAPAFHSPHVATLGAPPWTPPAPWTPPVLNFTVPAAMPAPAAAPQAVTSGPDALADVVRLADAGDMKAALQACDAAILREPLCAPAYYYHGMILHQYGEWAAAERSLRRCLYLDRQLALAHFYLGLVQEKLGQDSRRHYVNARALLAGRPEDAPVPLGQGLTVREFRSLLNIPVV